MRLVAATIYYHRRIVRKRMPPRERDSGAAGCPYCQDSATAIPKGDRGSLLARACVNEGGAGCAVAPHTNPLTVAA